MSSTTVRSLLLARVEQYKRAALAEKQSGNLDLAKRYAINYKLCQRAIETIDQGLTVDLSSLPPDLSSVATVAASQPAAPAAPTPTDAPVVTAATASARCEKYKQAALRAKHAGDLVRAKQLAVDWKRCQKLLERVNNGERVDAALLPADIDVDLTPPPPEVPPDVPRLHMDVGRVVRPFPPEFKRVHGNVMQDPETQQIIAEEQRYQQERRKWQEQQMSSPQEEARSLENQRVQDMATPS
eukprot:TRINITY_DN19899_c0_g1_i1.p2 TRINITY_DN19899_c0_g1~~TRINITY_DN19899_c0_g1_i1.p2  ORF type:complete len:241 (+),score=72.75 TRINITY_DN19899_c0_g1_i1:158-880(+)